MPTVIFGHSLFFWCVRVCVRLFGEYSFKYVHRLALRLADAVQINLSSGATLIGEGRGAAR